VAAPPKVDGRLKNQQHPARRPDEEAVSNPDGPDYLVRVTATADQKQNSAELQAGLVAKETGAQHKRRLITEQALLMLADGDPLIDIADALGLAPGTITGYITKYKQRVRKGAVDLQLDRIAVPLATTNLIHGLLAGDKDYTLETLKGRGHLRRHTADNSTVKHEIPPLVIRFEKPTHSMDPTTASNIGGGRVVGAAALPAPDIDTYRLPDGTHEPVAAPVAVGRPAVPSEDF
jgi:hypothetical protein